MIKVQNLTKSFGQVKAVDGLSFEVKKGEVVGFLGPNGAGKTTTMRLMTGFLFPDSGQITIGGVPVNEQTIRVQKHIGYLPENNPLYKDMLVSEILNLSADLKQIPKEKRKEAFDFVVSAVGLGDVFYRPVKELSKGYKQRTGMAIALLRRPDVIIMDEPTEGLDPNQRTEIRSLIKKLAEDHTIIMSTHVMQEAAAVCSRMMIINKGKLIANGTPDELSRSTAKHDRVIYIDVEGKNVESSINGLVGIKKADIEKSDNGIFRIKLTVDEKVEIRPELSRFTREHGWTMWRLFEEERKLEDIFQQITSE